MKQHEPNVAETLDRTLGLFRKPPAELMDLVQERVAKRLQSEPHDEAAWCAEPGPQRRSRRRSSWIAAAAIAAAITIAIVLPTRVAQSAPAVLEDVHGSHNVQYGELVRSGDDMNAMLAIAGGARVEIRSMSELSLERADDGVRIRLNNGGVIVDAAAQPVGNLYVQTKDVVASVGGAVSLVKAEEQGSRVAAIEGEVHVQHGATEKKLRPGEQVTSNPKMETLSVKEEVLWSSQAVAHVARLEQATPSASSRTSTSDALAFEVATIRPAAAGPTGAAPPTARGGGGPAEAPGCGRVQLDPRRISFKNVSLHALVAWSLGSCFDLTHDLMPVKRLSGGPDWVKLQGWDIEALIPQGSVDPLPTTAFGGPVTELDEGRSPKVQEMIRKLVEQRFKVVVRREMREMPVYVLTVAPGGPKFQGSANLVGGYRIGPGMVPPDWNPSKPLLGADGTPTRGMSVAEGAQTISRIGQGPCSDDAPRGRGRTGPNCANGTFTNLDLDGVARALSRADYSFAGRLVLNRTGIQGRVSFVIYLPEDPFVRGKLPQAFTFQELAKGLEGVGLKLTEDSKGLVEVYVIERAEKPSEN